MINWYLHQSIKQSTSITYDTEDTFDALGMFPIYQEY